MSLTTEYPLGPLTTLFTPPTQCLETVTYTPEATIVVSGEKSTQLEYLALAGTHNAIDLACYPSGYQTDHLYSPGICPSGWTSACDPYRGSYFISAPTTGVQCCPMGLTCRITSDHQDFAYCAQMTDTGRPAWIVTQGWAGPEGVLTTTKFPSLEVKIKPIFVAYQATDQAVLDVATKTHGNAVKATEGQSSSSATEISAGDSAAGASSVSSGAKSTSEESSMSSGTIAGIVVGAVIAGLLLAASIFLLLRFCFGYRWTRTANEKGKSAPNETWEYRADQSAVSFASNHPLATANELPSHGQRMIGRHELQDGQRHELDGDQNK